LYSKNSTIFDELHRNISQDPRVTMDRNKLTSLASQLFLDLGYTGKVKVLITGTENYKEVFMTIPLIQFGGNYSLALYQLSLPKHDRNTLFLLGNATQINPELVDFEPIILKDFEGNTFVIQSKNIARDIWMIVEHLKHTPYLINYPEMYEAFNIKVQQNAFDILDNSEMHKLSEYYKPTDSIIWDKVIIPQWEYYWNSTPQAGNVSKRITFFAWYNSTLLKELISNETDRKIALMYFWELPTRVADLDEWLDGKPPFIVYHIGLDAMQYQIQQMPRVYEEVISKYPNGTVYAWGKDRDIRVFYYSWLNDRQVHGLNNTIQQLVGCYLSDINYEDDPSILLKYNSIDAYLSKNFSAWDLIKFIYGYGIEYGGGDSQMDLLYYPIAFKALGIPYELTHYFEHYINAPARYACGYDGGIIGLPDSIVKPLKDGKYGEALIPPGNLIDPLSIGLDGIRKDLEYGKQNPVEPNLKYIEHYLKLRGNKIVFFSGGKKG